MQSIPDTARLGGAWLSVVAGLAAMIVAMCFQNITVFGSYVPVLILALAFTVLANLCFLLAFRRGGTGVRSICAASMLPTLYVVTDCFNRLPRFQELLRFFNP